MFNPAALGDLFGGDPARLDGLLTRFADSAAADASAIGQAMAAGDLAGVAAAAHRLKGAAHMAGA
ncbi:MAG: Hpt domain-containing protein, partial [Acetobacteraceae bacterium]|nr:Hpt domain-containing protein [Acetobacteraceae bacterium]